MAWYWPKIEDVKTAQSAALEGVVVGLVIKAVTNVAATLSIVYRKPVLGIDGGAFVDAALFAMVSWRIYKMSRPWAIVGLLLYLTEVAWRVAKHVGSSDTGFSAGFTPVCWSLFWHSSTQFAELSRSTDSTKSPVSQVPLSQW